MHMIFNLISNLFTIIFFITIICLFLLDPNIVTYNKNVIITLTLMLISWSIAKITNDIYYTLGLVLAVIMVLCYEIFPSTLNITTRCQLFNLNVYFGGWRKTIKFLACRASFVHNPKNRRSETYYDKSL